MASGNKTPKSQTISNLVNNKYTSTDLINPLAKRVLALQQHFLGYMQNLGKKTTTKLGFMMIFMVSY